MAAEAEVRLACPACEAPISLRLTGRMNVEDRNVQVDLKGDIDQAIEDHLRGAIHAMHPRR